MNNYYGVKFLKKSEAEEYFMRQTVPNKGGNKGEDLFIKGKLAEKFEIEEDEKIDADDWRKLLEFFFKKNKADWIAGIEMTFIMPKYVTVLAVLGEKELRDKILAAQDTAVTKTMSWVESYDVTCKYYIHAEESFYVGQHLTENILYVLFPQFLITEEGKPIIYTNVFIFNATLISDGKTIMGANINMTDKKIEMNKNEYMYNLMNSLCWENIEISTRGIDDDKDAPKEEFSIPAIGKRMVELLYNEPYDEPCLPPYNNAFSADAGSIKNTGITEEELKIKWNKILSDNNLSLKRAASDYYRVYKKATAEDIDNAIRGSLGRLTD